MIVQSRYKYTPTCDGCGAVLEPEYDYFEAAATMRKAGWLFMRPDTASGEWYNFCPACRERRKKNADD